MKLTRREFAAIAVGELIGAAGIAGFVVGGCNAAGVWSEIETWLPKGIASFEAIVTLVDPIASPTIVAAAELVRAGFAVLSAAVDQYIAAPAADKATFLGKVQTAFTAVTQNINQFLAAIGQSAKPIVKLAVALATIILSTIEGFMQQIGPAPVPATLRVGAETVTVAPVQRNKKTFIADFNAACVAGGHPELSIR